MVKVGRWGLGVMSWERVVGVEGVMIHGRSHGWITDGKESRESNDGMSQKSRVEISWNVKEFLEISNRVTKERRRRGRHDANQKKFVDQGAKARKMTVVGGPKSDWQWDFSVMFGRWCVDGRGDNDMCVGEEAVRVVNRWRNGLNNLWERDPMINVSSTIKWERSNRIQNYLWSVRRTCDS